MHTVIYKISIQNILHVGFKRKLTLINIKCNMITSSRYSNILAVFILWMATKKCFLYNNIFTFVYVYVYLCSLFITKMPNITYMPCIFQAFQSQACNKIILTDSHTFIWYLVVYISEDFVGIRQDNISTLLFPFLLPVGLTMNDRCCDENWAADQSWERKLLLNNWRYYN